MTDADSLVVGSDEPWRRSAARRPVPMAEGVSFIVLGCGGQSQTRHWRWGLRPRGTCDWLLAIEDVETGEQRPSIMIPPGLSARDFLRMLFTMGQDEASPATAESSFPHSVPAP